MIINKVNVFRKNRVFLLSLLLFITLAELTSLWSVYVGSIALFLYLKFTNNNLFNFTDHTILFVFLACFFTFIGQVLNNISLLYALQIPIALFLFYIFGRYIGRACNNNGVDVLLILLFFAFSLGLIHIYQTFSDINQVGVINPSRILTTLGSEQTSVTQRIVSLSMCLAGSSMLFMPFSDQTLRKFKKYFSILALFALICAIHFVSRTGLIMFLFSVIFGLFYGRKLSFKGFLLLLLFLVAIYMFFKDSDIFQLYLEREEIDKTSLDNIGSRNSAWTWGLNEIWKHFWGSPRKLNVDAHNFFLDYSIQYGIISSISLLLVTLNNATNILSIIKSHKLPKEIEGLFIINLLLIIAAFMTEPVVPIFIISYMFYSGFCNALSKKKQHLKS